LLQCPILRRTHLEQAEQKHDDLSKSLPPYDSHYKSQAPAYSPPVGRAASAAASPAEQSTSAVSAASASSDNGKKSKKAAKAPPPLKPTDPHPGDNEYHASLRAWAREKEYMNDNFGGHKGVAVGEPNDPFKVFRWVGRKLRGKPTNGGRSHHWEPSRPGEVADGEVDTHNLA
jgi:hypothetical protein